MRALSRTSAMSSSRIRPATAESLRREDRRPTGPSDRCGGIDFCGPKREGRQVHAATDTGSGRSAGREGDPMSMSLQRRTRRQATGLTALLAVLLSLVLVGPTASADSAHQLRPGFGYLALGDSVPFGYRPPQVTVPTAYLDASNFVGYPEIVADRTGVTLANASCPGETTASLI